MVKKLIQTGRIMKVNTLMMCPMVRENINGQLGIFTKVLGVKAISKARVEKSRLMVLIIMETGLRENRKVMENVIMHLKESLT